MKKVMTAFAMVVGFSGVMAQTAPAAPTPPAPPTAPTLSAEQKATDKAASQAQFNAMSRADKQAQKGHKTTPAKPAAPARGR